MKINISIRLYATLNDFLDKEKHQQEFQVSIKEGMSVKDLIETLGVPDADVDLILVNGDSVPLPHVLRDGDRISVYPMFETFDIANISKLRKL